MITVNRRNIMITEGPIGKNMLRFFFPILLGTFFQQLYNTADAIIVGNYVGQEALAAVGGASGNLINLILGFFMGMSGGATVIVAQYFGARDVEGVSNTVHTGIATCLTIGAVLTCVGFLITPVALGWMNTPSDVMPMAKTYMRIFFLGTVSNMVYNIGSGILRAIGDSRRPLYFLICSCLVNIVLDLLFVTAFRMGVLGVALATIISQTVSAALVITVLVRSHDCYHLSLRHIRFHRETFRRIIRIGLPAGFQSMMYNISNTLIQATINSFGSQTMAAWTAFGKIDGIFWMVANAFGITNSTFCGQNFGARKYGRMRACVQTGFMMSASGAVVIGALFIILRRVLLGLFLTDATTIEIGVSIMMAEVPFYLAWIPIEIISGTCRSAGEAVKPMLITACGICLLRILWLVLVMPRWHEITVLASSYPFTWAMTSIIFFVYYKSMNWLTSHLPEDIKPEDALRQYRSGGIR